MKKSSYKLLCCLNTPSGELQKILFKHNYNFKLMTLKNSEIPNIKNLILGFNSISLLIDNIKNLKRPAILWESASLIRQLILSQPVDILDADIKTDGLILFKPLNVEKLLGVISNKFNYKSKVKIESVGGFDDSPILSFGNNSILSNKFNIFLNTLPAYIQEPTIISFITSLIEQDSDIFDTFIINNRLLTKTNKTQYVDFVEYLTNIYEEISYYIFNKNKLSKLKDKNIKLSLKRLIYLISYYSSNKINSYIDVEKQINTCSVSV